jgi:hypothetical protein
MTAAPFTRRVFYIPGYDPFPARRYRELYRAEAARQAALSGHRIEVAGSGAPGVWTVASVIEGRPAAARIEVLGWHDIVQASMGRGLWAPWADLARVTLAYVPTGVLRRLARLRKGPVLAGLYPAAMILAQGLTALVAARLGLWDWGAVASRSGLALGAARRLGGAGRVPPNRRVAVRPLSYP